MVGTGWDSVLDLDLDIVNHVRYFNFQGDSLASQCLDKDLHTPTQPEDDVKGALLPDIIVGEGAVILELFASEDETLLAMWDTILPLTFDIINGIGRLDFKGMIVLLANVLMKIYLPPHRWGTK